MPEEGTEANAEALLERFVVENDELAELEAEIGRLNIFDALGIVHAEIRHSNFLAWLLDPAESHGQGQLFLSAVLMDVLRNASPSDRPLSPIDLDGADLRGVQVRREWQHIDVLIVIDEPRVVIAIENKILSGEHSGQLVRYTRAVHKAFPDHRPFFVFLTREGDEPSEERWCPYDFGQLHGALGRCLRRNEDSIGEEVRVFLGHYLAMLRSRFMDNPKIDELVDRIYRNHRQALDLIFERKSDPRKNLVIAFQERLSELARSWVFSDRTMSSCRFTPAEWLEILPPINSRVQMEPSGWIFGSFRIGSQAKRAWIEVVVGPTTEPRVRSELVDAIKASNADSGFKLSREKLTDRWTRVRTITVAKNKDGLVDDEETVARVRKAAEEIFEVTAQMTDFLRAHFT